MHITCSTRSSSYEPSWYLRSAREANCCSKALLSSSVSVCSLRECPRGYPWHFSLSVYPLSHPEFTRLHMVFLGILASTKLAVTLSLLASAHKREKMPAYKPTHGCPVTWPGADCKALLNRCQSFHTVLPAFPIRQLIAFRNHAVFICCPLQFGRSILWRDMARANAY